MKRLHMELETEGEESTSATVPSPKRLCVRTQGEQYEVSINQRPPTLLELTEILHVLAACVTLYALQSADTDEDESMHTHIYGEDEEAIGPNETRTNGEVIGPNGTREDMPIVVD